MKIIEPSATIESPIDYEAILLHVERAIRTAYKSEDRGGTVESAEAIARRCIDSHHESVIEHASVTVRFIVDRGVSHELVRHRLCSFTQESTRYCNYGKGKFGGEITVVRPCFWPTIGDQQKWDTWQAAMQHAEDAYLALLRDGATAQEARSVLPNSLKTEVVVTANLREWRHVFRERTAKAAHPQMRQVMRPLLTKFKRALPVFFADIESPEAWDK